MPPGLLAGRYRILSPLGTGGMGEVFLAEDTRLDHPFICKVYEIGSHPLGVQIHHLVERLNEQTDDDASRERPRPRGAGGSS